MAEFHWTDEYDFTAADIHNRYTPDKVINFALDFDNNIRSQVEHSWPLARKAELNVGINDEQIQLRLSAGRVSELTISGLDDWHFNKAHLQLSNTHSQIAVGIDKPYDSANSRVIKFSPPKFVKKLIVENPNGNTLSVESTASDDWNDISLNGNIVTVVNTHYSVIKEDSARHDRMALIVDNAPQTISVATQDDRVLHRIPQILAFNDQAQTPDLANILNAASGPKLILNIISQSDGILSISALTEKFYKAHGWENTQALRPSVIISPWQSHSLMPVIARGPVTSQTCTISGSAQLTGLVHAGLWQDSFAATRQHTLLHSSLRLSQPFKPFSTPLARPLQVSGLWLGLSEIPEEETKLTATISILQEDKSMVSGDVATAVVICSPRQMDYQKGPDGLYVVWADFEEPWALDTPLQDKWHRLTLKDQIGPAKFAECSLTHERLKPSLSQNVRKSVMFEPRDFGKPGKALVFELGITPTSVLPAVLSFKSGDDEQAVILQKRKTSFDFQLPAGPIELCANAMVEISDLDVVTQAPPQ